MDHVNEGVINVSALKPLNWKSPAQDRRGIVAAKKVSREETLSGALKSREFCTYWHCDIHSETSPAQGRCLMNKGLSDQKKTVYLGRMLGNGRTSCTGFSASLHTQWQAEILGSSPQGDWQGCFSFCLGRVVSAVFESSLRFSGMGDWCLHGLLEFGTFT